MTCIQARTSTDQVMLHANIRILVFVRGAVFNQVCLRGRAKPRKPRTNLGVPSLTHPMPGNRPAAATWQAGLGKAFRCRMAGFPLKRSKTRPHAHEHTHTHTLFLRAIAKGPRKRGSIDPHWGWYEHLVRVEEPVAMGLLLDCSSHS